MEATKLIIIELKLQQLEYFKNECQKLRMETKKLKKELFNCFVRSKNKEKRIQTLEKIIKRGKYIINEIERGQQ